MPSRGRTGRREDGHAVERTVMPSRGRLCRREDGQAVERMVVPSRGRTGCLEDGQAVDRTDMPSSGRSRRPDRRSCRQEDGLRPPSTGVQGVQGTKRPSKQAVAQSAGSMELIANPCSGNFSIILFTRPWDLSGQVSMFELLHCLWWREVLECQLNVHVCSYGCTNKYQ